MAERLIAPVLKTGLGKTNGGSNPSLSAEKDKSVLKPICPLSFLPFKPSSNKLIRKRSGLTNEDLT